MVSTTVTGVSCEAPRAVLICTCSPSHGQLGSQESPDALHPDENDATYDFNVQGERPLTSQRAMERRALLATLAILGLAAQCSLAANITVIDYQTLAKGVGAANTGPIWSSSHLLWGPALAVGVTSEGRALVSATVYGSGRLVHFGEGQGHWAAGRWGGTACFVPCAQMNARLAPLSESSMQGAQRVQRILAFLAARPTC